MSFQATTESPRVHGKMRPCNRCGIMRQRGVGGRALGPFCRDCKRPAREMGWTDETNDGETK
ncbi:hypothetical protein JOE65_000717 [Arthrobacter roseus]|nr:hypothetical protein [Arthrobacter roseus]